MKSYQIKGRSMSEWLGIAVGAVAISIWLLPLGLIAGVVKLVERVARLTEGRALAAGVPMTPSRRLQVEEPVAA